MLVLFEELYCGLAEALCTTTAQKHLDHPSRLKPHCPSTLAVKVPIRPYTDELRTRRPGCRVAPLENASSPS